MIKRIEPQNKNSNSQIVKGTIQQINEKGLKVNDRWFNFSKFLSRQEKPKLNSGDAVEFLANGGFITKFISIEKSQTQEEQNAEAKALPSGDAILLESLRSAVQIASVIESEVSIKFSTQDIIKLALTLFIQKSTNL